MTRQVADHSRPKARHNLGGTRRIPSDDADRDRYCLVADFTRGNHPHRLELSSPRRDLCLCHAGNADRAVAVSVGGDLTVATLSYQNAELTPRVFCEQDSGRACFTRVHEI